MLDMFSHFSMGLGRMEAQEFLFVHVHDVCTRKVIGGVGFGLFG